MRLCLVSYSALHFHLESQEGKRLTIYAGSFVNPIGLENADWKYLIVYVCWLVLEIVIIWFFFPETYGKTLEELTFCKYLRNAG